MSIKVIKPFLFNTNLVFDSKDTIIRNLKTKIVILENRIKQLESLIENKRKLTRANSYTKHQSNNLILTNFKSVKLINPQELLNNIDISPNNNSQSPHKTKMRLQKYRNLSLHNIKHNTNVSSESTSISGVVVNNNNNNTHNKTRNKFKCEAIPRLPRNIRIVGNNTVNNKNGYLTPSYTDGGSGKKIKGKINCGDNSCDDGKRSVVNERDDGCRSMVKCFTVGNNTPRKKVFSKGKVKGFGKGDLNLNKNWSSHNNNNSEGSGKQQYGGVNMQLKCIKERTRKLLTQLISMNYNCKCACK